jgi:hypothetical protein
LGSALVRQVKVFRVASSPVAPPEAFQDISELLFLKHSGGVRTRQRAIKSL